MFDRTDLEIPAVDPIMTDEDDVRRNYYIGRLHNGCKPLILEDSDFEWLSLVDVIEKVDDQQVQHALKSAQSLIGNLYDVAK